MLGPARGALITAFMAADLFIVLPILIQTRKELLERHGLVDDSTRTLPDVIVPTSFNFPHTGKLLSVSFILFAGWFADAAVPATEYFRLALIGLLTLFGSATAAVPFLLDLFRIPADTFHLFLATSVVNVRVGALLAALHTVTVALLGSAAILGVLRFRPVPIARYLAVNDRAGNSGRGRTAHLVQYCVAADIRGRGPGLQHETPRRHNRCALQPLGSGQASREASAPLVDPT